MENGRRLLQIADLSVGYQTGGGFHPVVRGAALAVDRGEFVALVGESGCGKTTLVRGLLGLLRANGRITGGSVSFLGETVSSREITQSLGSRIGFIPQDPMAALNPVRLIGKQMEEVFLLKQGLPRKNARARCLELLEKVRLGNPERVLASYPHQLSGGMAQRVVLAMALSLAPSLFIADEPTSAIDALLRRELLEMIRGFCREGMGVLFITHDLLLAGRYADSIIVMKDGAVVERGLSPQILGNPFRDYARLLTELGRQG